MTEETTEDYYVCTDDRFNDKKVIRGFHEWEQIYYDKFYPHRDRDTIKMFIEFVEWGFINLSFRYTK